MRRRGLRPAFFFEGAIRLTEGETLSFAERASYDWVRRGRFFQVLNLKDLGEIHLKKVHSPFLVGGKDRKVAIEFALGEDVQGGDGEIVYVNNPLKYKGFEFYRDKEGYSPLFVLRDMRARVLYGAYVPLQSIIQPDGNYLYTSGSAVAPGSFDFPRVPHRLPLFKLQTAYYPDEEKKRAGEVSFQIWKFNPHDPVWGEELFSGKAALGEMVRAGDYFLSMDEVRYWASMKVIYRPGLTITFSSFWIGLGGITLSTIQKLVKSRKKEARKHE